MCSNLKERMLSCARSDRRDSSMFHSKGYKAISPRSQFISTRLYRQSDKVWQKKDESADAKGFREKVIVEAV